MVAIVGTEETQTSVIIDLATVSTSNVTYLSDTTENP